MTKAGVVSLVIGLLALAVALPYLVPAVQELNRSTALMKEFNDERVAEQAAPPVVQSAAPVVAEAPKPVPEPPKEEAKAAPQKPVEAPQPVPESVAAVYITPSCADSGNLRQAVNPNPRATQYSGQLLVGNGTGAKLHPCTQARAFGNTGEPRSTGKLAPGEHTHPTLGKFSVGRR